MNKKETQPLRRRVWTFSELYYPEETSTGHFMTKITEALSYHFETFSICSQPSYGLNGVKVQRTEVYNGVNIFRVSSTTFNKDKFFLKFINILTFGISTLIVGINYVRRNDTIFVVTNPPFLPFIAMLVCKIRGASYILRIDDVYPDVLFIANKLKRNGFVAKIFNYLNKLLYRNAKAIVVLGRDMKQLIIEKDETNKGKIKTITNWGETSSISPNENLGIQFRNELGLKNKFVLLWAGNMGIPHGINDLFKIVTQVKDNQDIHFLFIGSGVKKKWLINKVNKNNLSNCTFLDPMPRSEQEKFLNSSDIVLSSLIPGMEGVSVPSRMYNIFSAGKPIFGIGENNAEMAYVIEENEIGWNIQPGDIARATNIINQVSLNKKQLISMGKRARQVAINKYSQKSVLKVYLSYFIKLLYEKESLKF